MAEPELTLPGDDDQDLPRTLRRARAERQRETEQGSAARAGQGGSYVPASGSRYAGSRHAGADEYADQDDAFVDEVTVTRLEIPFFHLMGFFIKAVFAAIPALILLFALIWGIGELIEITAPELLKMRIIIQHPLAG